MSTGKSATRRGFFGRAGAVLVAPLAATQALAGDDAQSELAARLAELEDVNAIRALQRAFARAVSAGSAGELAALYSDPAAAEVEAAIRSIVVDALGDGAFVELHGDGNALVNSPCTVESAVPIGPDCTLVEMARLQGEGVIRRSERRLLELACAKRDGAWKITRATFRTV
jgi:hypothetical protein